MKKFLQKKLKDQKGMTLIELLAVIVIIAIIAAIAIPAIGNIIENSRYSAVKSDAQNVLAGANIYFTENPGAGTVTLTALQTGGYLESFGNFAGGDSVTKPATGPIEFTNATPINYSGSKTLKFTGATVDEINANTTKGSAAPATVEIGS
ncbi:prepilin-type N-terminal cleavage/methylation domain-containing protein [Planococcus sp. 1R117A]|uniref:prepilin-type N-terminal cleavage/methylation domain-containing protein n=1 Tax=Planococcus sp. 1R117A TaxID=3447020 RepID=UPI003EDC9257